MLAVLIVSLFNSAALIAFIAGIVGGIVTARDEIGETLRFDPLAAIPLPGLRPAAEMTAAPV